MMITADTPAGGECFIQLHPVGVRVPIPYPQYSILQISGSTQVLYQEHLLPFARSSRLHPPAGGRREREPGAAVPFK
jgi:hypothetical protein